MKKIILVLSLVLTIPMISFANNDFNILEDKSFEKRQHHKYNDTTKDKENPEGIRLKKKEFRKPLKNLPDDVKEKLLNLKKQLLDGEITEDQFNKEIEKIMPQQYKFKGIKKDSLKRKAE